MALYNWPRMRRGLERGDFFCPSASSAKDVLTKLCLSLRDTILQKFQACLKATYDKLNALRVPECTEATVKAFLGVMTPLKCTQVTDSVKDGEQIWELFSGLTKSWSLECEAIYGDSPKLRKLLDQLYKAVFSAFALKCIASRSAQKRLASAAEQAKKALAVAQANKVVLDAFIIDDLKAIRDGKSPQYQA